MRIWALSFDLDQLELADDVEIGDEVPLPRPEAFVSEITEEAIFDDATNVVGKERKAVILVRFWR